MFTPSIIGAISPDSTAALSGRWLSAAAWPWYSMVTRRITPSRACVSWPAKPPSSRHSSMYGLRRGASSAETDGMLIALVTAPLSRKSLICSAT